MKLLCISNGHGEDAIALRILQPLRQIAPQLELFALPITGAGSAFAAADIPLLGPTQVLPSGGFLNRDPRALARDVQGGLLRLTRSQLSAVRNWRKQGDIILAVGDIVPLLFAYLSGLPYAFVGTAKSEYWLRDEQGKLPAKTLLDKLEGWSGSVYLPWERWLMARCLRVFVRDALTASQLQHLGIAADYTGNPMMDQLFPTGQLTASLTPLLAASLGKNLVQDGADNANHSQPLSIALLPGSREPEAYENWERLLAAAPYLAQRFQRRSLVLLAAVAPHLSLERLQQALGDWQTQLGAYPTFTYQNLTLLLVNDAYSDCLHQAQLAIATAGTATEQFVGLGKPAITLPGNGPQFTPAFATVQAKMLGPSIQRVSQPAEVAPAIEQLLADPARLQRIYENGKHRMGEPGAGERIARQLWQTLQELERGLGCVERL